MKSYYLFTFLLCVVHHTNLKAQYTQGTVSYQTVIIDTIHDEINPQDSVFTQFSFKPNKTKWEMGFLDRSMYLQTIQNGADYYILVDEQGTKSALQGEMPETTGFDQLMKYSDNELIVTKFETDKTIAGHTCKKISLKVSESDPGIILWYDETVDCNSLIPNAGLSGLCIKGLILEYEIPNAFGKNIVTASQVDFDEVPEELFQPNLTEYEVVHLE